MTYENALKSYFKKINRLSKQELQYGSTETIERQPVNMFRLTYMVKLKSGKSFSASTSIKRTEGELNNEQFSEKIIKIHSLSIDNVELIVVDIQQMAVISTKSSDEVTSSVMELYYTNLNKVVYVCAK